MLNTLSVILTIIILIVVSLIFIVTYIFQNSVEQNLNTTSSELSLVFSGFQSDSSTSFTASARDYVENFDKKEEMEVLVINSSGRVVMTSTGFTPDDNEQIQFPILMMHSQTKTAVHIGTASFRRTKVQ